MPNSPDRSIESPTPSHGAYWRTNLRYVAILLSIWFAVSYGAGILFAETLDRFTLPGTSFPLGFWFAQQGSIYIFVVLIFVYVWLMNRLDRRHGVDEGDAAGGGAPEPRTPASPPRTDPGAAT